MTSTPNLAQRLLASGEQGMLAPCGISRVFSRAHCRIPDIAGNVNDRVRRKLLADHLRMQRLARLLELDQCPAAAARMGSLFSTLPTRGQTPWWTQQSKRSVAGGTA